MMQQQMFDQFQQAMAMMVQMFGTMHRDQMEVIRAELDRLRELTDEFHGLKNGLAERTREKPELKPREPELTRLALIGRLLWSPAIRQHSRSRLIREPVRGLTRWVATSVPSPKPFAPKRVANSQALTLIFRQVSLPRLRLEQIPNSDPDS